MDEEPSRYRSQTGATAYGIKPLDSQIFDDIKQCEEPESIRVCIQELNPTAICCTRDGDIVAYESEPEESKSDRNRETRILT